MKDWKSQFREWLKEIIPGDRIEPYVQFYGCVPTKWGMDVHEVRMMGSEWSKYDVPSHLRETLRIRVFTKENKYTFGVKENYLGCTVSTRKPRAGEDWERGSDLPDGKFSRETWEKIKHAIIRYELVKVMKRQERIKDEAPSSEELAK